MQFRFNAQELLRLAEILDLITSTSGYMAMAVEPFSLLYAWLRSPEDLMSLSIKYACSATASSEIINDTANHTIMHDTISSAGITRGSFPLMLQQYADALADFGALCKNVLGLLTIQLARPAADCCRVYEPKQVASSHLKSLVILYFHVD